MSMPLRVRPLVCPRRVQHHPLLPVRFPSLPQAGLCRLCSCRRSNISPVDLLRQGIWRGGRIQRESWIDMWIRVGGIVSANVRGIETGIGIEMREIGIGIMISDIIVGQGGLGGGSGYAAVRCRVLYFFHYPVIFVLGFFPFLYACLPWFPLMLGPLGFLFFLSFA